MSNFQVKLVSFFKESRANKIYRISNLFYRFKTSFIFKSDFKSIGKNCIIRKPIVISNPQFIELGDNVFIRDGIRLEVIILRNDKIPVLLIGDNVNIEQNVHIVCQNKVSIGNNVSITANCSIVDATHPYDNINADEKIGSRILDNDSFVEIGDGTFIGIGSTILPNVKIGKNVIIGANSVVVRNVPDYSVAAGAPAKVIKYFDHNTKIWKKV